MNDYILEVCVDSAESALAAAKGGASRLELCQNLVIGGTTPGSKLFEVIRRQTTIPIHALIRPRFGDFCYTPYELEEIREEVAMYRELGAEGVEVGVLKEDGTMNMAAMEQLMEAADGMSVTLHRAFDVCRDPKEALEQAVSLGMNTILTSGQQNSAVKGAELLAELQRQAAGRIRIQAGGGICADAIRELAKYTDEMLNRFINLAISYNINIITGSMPLIKDDGLYNVGFLCRRDGSYETYEKVHITPDEAKSWGLSGGKMVQTFETDCAKIGVLICYDVEFPELSRIMADQGMQILFVPFLTDTQNAYSRVRVCAQARAIENECFVVIAGSVGNLPRVHNMDIQYAQSGVFTPCDFAFPTDGKRAEATPNTEMILVSDVDLDLLNELHTYGSVRNLKDRRHDLYEVKMKRK